MSIVNNNIKNAAQCVMDWVLDKEYTDAATSCSIANSQIALYPGVNCTGTLVASDIATKASCADLTAVSNRVTCLESCSGLNCTGTLVASDIANKASCTDLASVSTRVSCLEGCPGLDCVGTLVASDLTLINQDITNLKSCSGLNCTGTLTSANFSLSGTTLTITI